LADTRSSDVKLHASFDEARAKIHMAGATMLDKQEFLLAAADRVLELLNNLKARVEASDVEDKEAQLADINAAIEAMTNAKAEISAIDTTTATREEIRAAANDLREAWKQAQSVLKKGALHVVNKRVGNVIQRMDHLSDKLERILAHLTEKGFDVSAAAELQTQFDAKVDSAETHYTASKSAFDSGDVQTANKEMRLAMSDLKDANSILKDIVKSIRSHTKGEALAEAEASADTNTTTEASDSESETTESEDTDEAGDNDATETEQNETTEQESEAPEQESDEDEESNVEVNATTDVDANVNVTV
jgi:hypothetical protein